MAKYLLSGLSPDGRKVTEVVIADSANEATRQFRESGNTDVVLHSDEVFGHIVDPEVHGDTISPREFVELSRLSRLGLMWWTITKVYRQFWWEVLLALGFLGYRRYHSADWGILDALAVVTLAAPPAIVVWTELFGASARFHRAMGHAAWGRWHELRRSLPGLRGAVPDWQLAYHEAKALAGTGQLDEALEVFESYADDEGVPQWLYWGHLGSIYMTAKLPDRAIESLETAAELAPDNPTVLLDLAQGYLRYRRDPARAAPLVERARRQEISDMLLPLMEWVEGQLALAERRFAPAIEKLTSALQRIPHLAPGNPLMEGLIDRVHADLCLVHAADGNRAEAIRHFRRAEPRLEALEMDDLLQLCRAAVDV